MSNNTGKNTNGAVLDQEESDTVLELGPTSKPEANGTDKQRRAMTRRFFFVDLETGFGG